MKNIEQLIVRACKSDNPQKRLASVYRRFWLSPRMFGSSMAAIVMTNQLADLCQKYQLIELDKYVNKMQQSPLSGEEETINQRQYRILIETVRYTSNEKFEGLTLPLLWRKKTEENRDVSTL